MDDAVCILARDGTVTRCNRSMLRLLELELEEVLGRKCYELMHGARAFFKDCPYQEMLNTGRRESFEIPLDARWYQVTADPLFGEAEEIVGAVHIIRDVTSRARAEEALRKSERLLSLVYDNVGDVLLTLDVGVDGRFRVESVNRAFLETTGLTRGDVEGKLVDDVLAQPLRGAVLQHCATAVREKRTQRWEFSERHPTGAEVGDASVTPVLDEDGTCARLIGTVHDITARAHAEWALREQTARLVSLNALALDLAALDREAAVSKFLAGRLRELTGATAVAFSEYEPDVRVLATRSIELVPGALKTLTAPLVRRLEGTRSPVNAETYQDILGNLNATRATLTEASFGAIPAAVDATVRRLLGVDRFIGLSYVVEGALYGTSVIALRPGTPDPPRDLLDSFANLAAVSLRRRSAELELRAKTAEIHQMFALSDDLMCIAGMDGVIIRANPAWESALGLVASRLVGRPILDFVHPDDVDAGISAIAEMAAGRPVASLLSRVRHADGSYRLIEWHIAPFEGRLQFAVGRDITEKMEASARQEALEQEAAETLRRTNAYNRSLIEASLDPFVTIGPDGLITDVNAATVAVTGRTRNELVGSDFAVYFSEPDKAGTVYEQVFREGSVRDYPLAIRHRDGHLTDVLYNASTYQDTDDRAVGVFAVARDVSALRQAEQDMRHVNAELERRVEERTRELTTTNRDLQEFMYSLAHDLRTPLRAMDGFSFAVLEDYGGVIGDRGQDDLHRVRAAAQRMGVLIDALLQLSQLGQRSLEMRTVALSEIARRVIDDLRTRDPERTVEVTIEEGLTAASDEALVTIVLENLLGNAWKFTSRRPLAHIEFAAGERDGLRVFFVRDDGAGFDPAYAGKLFAPFQRLHAGDAFPGAGTGLATVARVLERLGGRWWAESEVGRGATFSFSLAGGDKRSGDA